MNPSHIGHPPDLLAAERHYLVRWGWPQVGLVGAAAAAGSAGLGLLAARHSALWLLLLVPLAAASGLSVLFFRNPGRRIPAERGVLLAPADGRVVEVATVEEPEYLGGRALKVGIFLSIFDVHLNRAPCSGRVEYLRRRPGRFLDARNPRSSRENEAQAVGIRRDDSGGPPGVKVLVRQVAGAIARRIICPLREDQPVERGRLLGMIKYGSRTELLVSTPPGGRAPEVQVRLGDHVAAGETVLYRYPS